MDAGFVDTARFVGISGPEVDDAFDEWLAGLLGGRSEAAALTRLLAERVEPALAALGPRPGVTELIAEAHAAGWKVGLGTGAARHKLETALTRMDLLGSFDAIVTTADVARGKPAPDVFLEVARRLGVRPEECVVVEDSLPGYEAAVAAGMRAVACPCELTASSPFPRDARIVASLAEVSLTDL